MLMQMLTSWVQWGFRVGLSLIPAGHQESGKPILNLSLAFVPASLFGFPAMALQAPLPDAPKILPNIFIMPWLPTAAKGVS